MKTVVVLSGGMDSATALGLMVRTHGPADVYAITFNYGSKHNAKENEAAKKLAEYYKIAKHEVVYMPFVEQLFKSDLLKSGGEVPEGHYAEENMKKTVVPFRNAIMLSIATGFAESVGAKQVVIGNHAGDHAIYPDCREDFMSAFGKAVTLGTWEKLTLNRPFENFTKADIVRQGTVLGVPYELTWSCYKGGDVHCGKCGTCVERKEAMALAGIKDPVAYSDDTYYLSALQKGPGNTTQLGLN